MRLARQHDSLDDRRVCFAFPYDDRLPAKRLKALSRALVAFAITRDFGAPIVSVAFWNARAALASMPVPETTVAENRNPRSHKDQVRLAWEIVVAQSPATQSRAPKQAAHASLEAAVTRLDCAHGAATLRVRRAVSG